MGRWSAVICAVVIGLIGNSTHAQFSGGGSSNTSDAEDARIEAENLAHDRAEARIKAAAPEMTFEYFRAASPSGGTIEANGMITENTLAALQTVIQRGEAEGGEIFYVKLNSLGGNLSTGIAMGELLRRRQITTVISREASCLSACAVAFLGGDFRNPDVIADGKSGGAQQVIGFHAFNVTRAIAGPMSAEEVEEVASDTSKETQITLGDLARYMSAMGIDPKLIQLAAPFGNYEFFFPSYSQLIELGIIPPEEDGGDFRLVPDGTRAIAAYQEGQAQLIFTCAPGPVAGALQPTAIISTLVWTSQEDRLNKWTETTKASEILVLPTLPWLPGDTEHGHFHAHNWLPIWDNNPVFGYALLVADSSDYSDTGGYVALTRDNATFRASANAFHIAVRLTAAEARTALTERGLVLAINEGEYHAPSISFHTHNTDQDRENIAFALKDCTP